MFHLDLLIRLISSKKYWILAKTLVSILKGVIQVKYCFYGILTKMQMKEESLNILKR